MLNLLKLHKKILGLLTLILIIIKLSFEYNIELLKTKPRNISNLNNVAKCTIIYNECITKTQSEAQNDYFSLACERVKDLCDKSCTK